MYIEYFFHFKMDFYNLIIRDCILYFKKYISYIININIQILNSINIV